MSSLGRYSAMLIPRSGGLDNNNFDAGDAPLNATVTYNPNTRQLIIVPSQPVGNDVYLLALGNMNASANDPLLNNAGEPAAVSGNAPYYATFELNVAGRRPWQATARRWSCWRRFLTRRRVAEVLIRGQGRPGFPRSGEALIDHDLQWSRPPPPWSTTMSEPAASKNPSSHLCPAETDHDREVPGG